MRVLFGKDHIDERKRPVLAAMALFIVGLSLSITLILYAGQQQDAEQAQHLDTLLRHAESQIHVRMQQYQYGLRGTRGYVMGAGPTHLERKGFAEYMATRNLDTEFPGARGFGFIRRVPVGGEQDFLRHVRADGAADAQVQTFIPHAGDRWLIEFIEPNDRNRKLIGLDVMSEPRRQVAITAAVRSGQATLTAPVDVVQSTVHGGHTGFIFFLPVYRSAVIPNTPAGREQEAVGLAYAPLLVDEIFSRLDFPSDELHVRLSDMAGGKATPFFQSIGYQQGVRGSLHRRLDMKVFGRQWQLEIRPTPLFYKRLHQTSLSTGFFELLFLDALLSALLYLYLVNRQKVMRSWTERARYAAIVENANDAIIGKDLDGAVTSWNNATQRIFQYSAEEAIGRNIRDLIVPDPLRDEETAILTRVAAGETVPHFITRRRRADGSMLDVSVTVSPIKDHLGRVVGAAKTLRDVTQQLEDERRIRESNLSLEEQVVIRTIELKLAQRDLQTIFDAVPSLIAYWDSSQHNRVANAAYHRWFGLPSSAIKGIHLSTLLGPERYAQNRHYIEAALRGEPQTFETQLPYRAGGPNVFRQVQMHFLPDVVGTEVNGFYVIAHDISDIIESRNRLEMALRENEALLATINRQLLYSVMDSEGHILSINENFCRRSGYSDTELLGKTHAMLSSGHHDAPSWAQVRETIAAGQTWHGEICNRARDGSLYWMDSVIAPLTGSDGRIERYLSLSMDVSQRKTTEIQLANVAKLLKSVLAAASEVSIIATDTDGVISMFNAGAAHMLQYTPEEMVGHCGLSRIHLPEEVAERVTELEALTGQAVSGHRVFVHNAEIDGAETRQWTYVRKDGSRLQASVAMTVMRDDADKVVGYLAVAQDITERLRVEQDLQLAKLEAEQGSQAKSSFLANMSHEIRTPMNGILGMCYLLERQALSPTAQGMVERIHLAGKSLLGILNDILDFSKIEAHRLELDVSEFRLSDVLDNLANIAGLALGDKPVEVIVGPVPSGAEWLRGDALRLSQVLTNLVGNAIKFTERGQVEISIRQVPDDSAEQTRLRFTVRDSGIGIETAKLDHIFAAFSQADSSTTRQYGGTGLGLAISRRLVELMGGQLHVFSRPGQGSEFSFEVSFLPVAAQAGTAAPAPLRRVLLVMPASAAADSLLQGMRGLGWQVHHSLSPSQAMSDLEALRQFAADTMLMGWPPGEVLSPDALSAWCDAIDPQHRMVKLALVAAFEAATLAESASRRVFDAVMVRPATAAMVANAVMDLRLTAEGRLATQHRRLSGCRLLVVDDSELNREVVHRILESEGAQVELASEGLEAVTLLQRQGSKVDAVLMDIQMPVMDGYEATRQIHALPGLAGLPVIALTAGVLPGQRAMAQEAGMTGFVSKPFNIREMVDAIRQRVHCPDHAEAEEASLEEDPAWQALNARLRGQFVNERRPALLALRQADPEDWPALRMLVHKIAGEAGMLGMAAIGDCARQLEQGWDREQTLTPALRQQLAGLIQQLESLSSQDEAA